MMPGISTASFYPRYPEDALRALAVYPIKCVEIFINCGYELQPPYLKELRKIADDAGIRIISVHPYHSPMEPMYFFSGYGRRFDEGMDVYRQYYQAANILGAELVVFHGAKKNNFLSRGRYIEIFARLHDDAKRSGSRLCQENVDRCASYSPALFAEMARQIPDVGFVLDIKQAVRADCPVKDYINAMDGRIAHVHISDHAPGKSCMVPGTGILNIDKLLTTLSKNGFDGAVVVELYRENFEGVVEIYAGYQHVCTTLHRLFNP